MPRRPNRRELFSSLFRPRWDPLEPDPGEARLTEHPKDRVRDLVAHLRQKNARSAGEEKE